MNTKTYLRENDTEKHLELFLPGHACDSLLKHWTQGIFRALTRHVQECQKILYGVQKRSTQELTVKTYHLPKQDKTI